ncbi:uncharacterized protein isoform X4 [Danio rerio]|uniref:Uncharacterized protein isoform X4 n=3 Tax=Danio rerio TaxID=7955 RepID=A0AC58JM85_DANRE|nr:interleukin-6 receptor subunit beta-like isoform X2 [Danio rerio]|eukprot:XP_017211833.1 interleukin-6 receptor subunit beta-like isoform X2 [Danio rerio]
MCTRLSEEATMRKCSAAFYFTLGFISVCTTEASAESSCCKTLSEKDQCNTEGVHDLRCFIKYKKAQPMSICEWKQADNISTSYKFYSQVRTKCSCGFPHQKNATWTSNEFSFSMKYNITAHVIGKRENLSCIYKNFSGIPSQMTQCGPHSNVTFKRRSGHITLMVNWGDESNYIENFHVKYREFNSTNWKKKLSKNNRDFVLWNTTSSLSYELQIQCIPSANCAECLPSEFMMVPPELTDVPSIQWEIQDHIGDDHKAKTVAGQRRVVVMWEYPISEAVAYYNVTVRKESGETSSQTSSYKVKNSSLILILSYSAYNISIRAFNNAGSSPVSSIIIERMDEWQDLFGPFSVNITSNNSFSLSWNSSISSVCYSVEWWAKGQIPAFQPFYVKRNHKEITGITKNTFQPNTRYYFFLHTRPDQDTCNMKNVNKSETTYGKTQAYLSEGSPIRAPGNVSVLNITQHSAVITWIPLSEEDLYGFLSGYYLYYWNTEDINETSIKVDPSINSYELLNLQSSSAYSVQLCAFTVAGEGERSDVKHFVTDQPEFTALNGIIAAILVGIIILLIAVHVSCRILHRAKKLLWPSIPDPEKSNAVQKIVITYELSLLEPLTRQKLEESEGCDSSTVCFIENKSYAFSFSSPSPSQAGVKLHLSEDEDSLSSMSEINPPDTPTQVPTRESVSTETFPLDFRKTDCTFSNSVNNEVMSLESKDSGETITGSVFTPATSKTPAVVFMSDYTTMEIFKQVTMNGIQSPSIQTVKPSFVAGHPGQDYIRQSVLQ